MKDPRSPLHLETRSVHAGEPTSFTPVTPIHRVSGFALDDVADLENRVRTQSLDAFYTRYANPTTTAVEEKLAALEGAEAGLIFSSGMAAITAAVMSGVEAGSVLLTLADIYGGTHGLFHRILPRFGVEVRTVPTRDDAALDVALAERPAMVYLETPTNPLLHVVDLTRICERAHAVGSRVVLDNTFATPLNQDAVEAGVDVIVHSATKYLGGHTDVVAGGLVGSRDLLRRIHTFRVFTGAILDPEAAWILQRGMKTFGLRMARHNANALAVASWLEEQEPVETVLYPGLPSHPDHAIARRQMSGFGGIVTLELAGGLERARRFVDHLELFRIIPSLGGVESSSTIPALTSHASMPRDQRLAAGITDGLVRLSIGIENADDLIEDLSRALEA